ncbi:MAG: serine/threonine-protein kinase [Planctomycetota bacterium]
MSGNDDRTIPPPRSGSQDADHTLEVDSVPSADNRQTEQPRSSPESGVFAGDSRSWAGASIHTGGQQPSPAGSRYRVLSKLGEGGFGIVYLAEQTEPIRRKVALKLLKIGLTSPSIIARFEAEQQALAMMDHPGLAKVFDAGTTPEGQPYFAMEFAPGEPFASLCDRRKLGIRERIELLAQVCDAIHHAHMKGVVHRDLKPSNILVSETDDGLRPKVIDFGIAKTLSASATDQVHETQFGQFVGTPVYMSPEQAEGGSVDIDTRSDIYSIGVIAYELLVGTTPIEAETLRASGIARLHRTIVDTECPRPSVRFKQSDLTKQSETSRMRRTEPAPFLKQLRTDLDWIVMRCLEKDRTRRYESASSLADDLRRYLDGEAVLAGPPSRSYRIKKFVRRHRVAVASAALALVGLVALTVQMGFLWRDAVVQQRRAQKTLEVFLQSIKSSNVTGSQAGASVRVADLLKVALDYAEADLKSDPDIHTELREQIAETLTSLTEFEVAAQQLAAAVEYRKEAARSGSDADRLALANAKYEFARTQFFLQRLADARTAYEEALALRASILPANDPLLATTKTHLSSVLYRQGDAVRGAQLSDEALRVLRTLLEDKEDRLISALFNRADNLWRGKQYAECRAFLNECADTIIKRSGPTDWRLGRVFSTLADLELVEGRLDLAVKHQRRVPALLIGRYGPTHATTTNGYQRLAELLGKLAVEGGDVRGDAKVIDRVALEEASASVRAAIEGRRIDDKSYLKLCDSLALLSILAQLGGDDSTALAIAREHIQILQTHTPHLADRIDAAERRLTQLTAPIPAPPTAGP